MMGTDDSFSEKALMLSCVQKTEQPANRLLWWGLWSAAGDGMGQRRLLLSPPGALRYLGQSPVFSYTGAEK